MNDLTYLKDMIENIIKQYELRFASGQRVHIVYQKRVKIMHKIYSIEKRLKEGSIIGDSVKVILKDINDFAEMVGK